MIALIPTSNFSTIGFLSIGFMGLPFIGQISFRNSSSSRLSIGFPNASTTLPRMSSPILIFVDALITFIDEPKTMLAF